MENSIPNRRRAWWALIALSVIWGYNWAVMKVAMRDAGAVDFAVLRTVLGSLSLFLVLVWRRALLAPTGFRGIALLGFLQTTAFFGLIVWAVSIGGAGKTAVLAYTMPFWVLVLAWPILGERIRGAQWLAVAVAFAGLLFILEPWHMRGEMPGEILAVVAGIAWAASVIVAKKLDISGKERLLSVTAWQMLFGSIPLVAIAMFVPSQPIHWTGTFIVALLYNVILGNALAWVLWLYILNNLPAGVASLSMLATPVLGVLAAWIQLGERPSATEGLGMLLVGVALALFSLQSVQQHRRLNAEMVQE
jgi:drug/metabolite transporter (DMT)-like permease